MKLALIVSATVLMSLSLLSATFDPKKYTELDLEKVKATPEEYKNKKVVIETVFVRYETTFLPYMEKSGYRAGKHYYMQVRPANFPVMAEKNDETNAMIPGLKAGSKVKLYGKIKKYSSAPEMAVWPLYHLELEHMEIIEVGNGIIDEEDRKDALTPGQKDHLRRKILK